MWSGKSDSCLIFLGESFVPWLEEELEAFVPWLEEELEAFVPRLEEDLKCLFMFKRRVVLDDGMWSGKSDSCLILIDLSV